ncbi:MAG: hypothetical protein D6744_13650 [Planctomycetota bacterium]|nr:MAG: hypothetical protein D6744_13650 [Planctomycetota bacterium]
MIVLAQTAQPEIQPLTPLGWAFMVASILFVLGLVVYCFSRVLATPDQNSTEHMHAPLDIDTQDAD